MFNLTLVAVNVLTAEITVDLMQVQTVCTGNKRLCIKNIRTQFIYVASFTWVIAVNLNTSG